MRSTWSFIILLSVLLLLAGCDTQEGTPAGELENASYEFVVDPGAEQVGLLTHQGNGIVPTAEGPRVLAPGSEIELAYFDYAFLPGNKLEIYATFRNVTTGAYFMADGNEQGFSFTPVLTPSQGNYLGSIEPGVWAGWLGGDLGNQSLSPGEVMREHCDWCDPWFTFEVTHKGQPFSYFVNVNALVGDLLDVIGAGDPLAQDGKLLYVGGNRVPPDLEERDWCGITVVRYLANGSLDTSFGSDGVSATKFNCEFRVGVQAGRLQSDNHIIAWGEAGYSGDTFGVFARYSPDGQELTSFSISAGQYTSIWEVTILPDDKIIIAGTGTGSGTFRSYYTPDFGVIATLWGDYYPVYPDGKTVYGGRNYSGANPDIQLVQHNTSDYSLDTGFGTNGFLTIDVGGNDDLTGLAASGTSILVTGTSDACPSGNFSFLVQADGSYNPATMCVP